MEMSKVPNYSAIRKVWAINSAKIRFSSAWEGSSLWIKTNCVQLSRWSEEQAKSGRSISSKTWKHLEYISCSANRFNWVYQKRCPVVSAVHFSFLATWVPPAMKIFLLFTICFLAAESSPVFGWWKKLKKSLKGAKTAEEIEQSTEPVAAKAIEENEKTSEPVTDIPIKYVEKRPMTTQMKAILIKVEKILSYHKSSMKRMERSSYPRIYPYNLLVFSIPS